MSELTIDDAVVALLATAKGETTLLDKNGKVIGRFRPEIDQAAMHAKYGHLWTAEDLARAEAVRAQFERDKAGLTTAEVLDYLRGLSAK